MLVPASKKVQADDPHGRDADGQHGLAGREQPQHLAGEELKNAEAQHHDPLCIAHRQPDGLF